LAVNMLHLVRRPHAGISRELARILGVAVFAAGLSWSAGDQTAAAQAQGTCALVTTDDVGPIASNQTVHAAVPTDLQSTGYTACRYTWGEGAWHFKLDVTVNDASRMFSGMSPDQIKHELQGSVRPGTADTVVTDIGEAAVFRVDSAAYVRAAAYVKGRLLQVTLDGVYASERKDQVIALLKTAASRLSPTEP
jgi:hypothetical protein